jgi:Protein of unknown function (DUF3147)
VGRRIAGKRRRLNARALRNVRWWEMGLRFLAGGCISAAAAVIDHAAGHKAGGAMLAFPAILPATLTLVDRKEGRRAAMRVVWGAYFGGYGMIAYALVVAALAPAAKAWALAAGLAAWTAISFGLFKFWSRTEPVPSDRSVTRGP